MNNMQPTTGEMSQFGMMARPQLAVAYPKLKEIINGIMQSRVAPLPWVPRNFFQQYGYFQYARSGDLIILEPASGPSGKRLPIAPDWLDTPEKVAAWTAIALDMAKAYGDYAAGEARAAEEKLARLRANASFWEGIGSLAKGVGDFAGGAADGVKSGVKTFVVGVLIVGSLAAVGYWYYKDPDGFKRFFGSFGKKARK